jgi:hypothetical protein
MLLIVVEQNSRLSGMIDNLLGDCSVGLLHNLVNVLGCLDRVRLLVDPSEFFEGTALGLDTGNG